MSCLLCSRHCEERSDHSMRVSDHWSTMRRTGEEIVVQSVSWRISTNNGLCVKDQDKWGDEGRHVHDCLGEVRTIERGKTFVTRFPKFLSEWSIDGVHCRYCQCTQSGHSYETGNLSTQSVPSVNTSTVVKTVCVHH